jgi:hypothetical protein
MQAAIPFFNYILELNPFLSPSSSFPNTLSLRTRSNRLIPRRTRRRTPHCQTPPFPRNTPRIQQSSRIGYLDHAELVPEGSPVGEDADSLSTELVLILRFPGFQELEPGCREALGSERLQKKWKMGMGIPVDLPWLACEPYQVLPSSVQQVFAAAT